MPHRPPSPAPARAPLARHRDLTNPLTAGEHDAFAHWQRLLDARLIGSAAPLPDDARGAIGAGERALRAGTERGGA